MPQNPASQTAPQPARPKPPQPPPEFREGDIAQMGATALVKLLRDASTTEFQKAKACVRAGELGDKEAIPALAALLNDEHLSVYARCGLEPIGDPAAGDALLAALPKLNHDRATGVINSLGKRKEAKAIPALTRLMLGANPVWAAAAAAALGNIGGTAAATQLTSALNKTKGPTRTAVADGCLVCAERLLGEGKRSEALALYTTVTTPDIPKPIRLAAMSGIIREETAVGRQR